MSDQSYISGAEGLDGPPSFEMTPSIAALAAAMAKAQGEIGSAHKDSDNSHFRSRYASLDAVQDACREALSKVGIAVIQIPYNDGDAVGVSTMLIHSSGEWIRGGLSVRPAKADAQGVGSTITYLRRYLLSSMVGVAPADDDGNAASGLPSSAGKTPVPPPTRRQEAPPTQPKDRPEAASDAGTDALRRKFVEMRKAVESAKDDAMLTQVELQYDRFMADLLKSQPEPHAQMVRIIARKRDEMLASDEEGYDEETGEVPV